MKDNNEGVPQDVSLNGPNVKHDLSAKNIDTATHDVDFHHMMRMRQFVRYETQIDYFVHRWEQERERRTNLNDATAAFIMRKSTFM